MQRKTPRRLAGGPRLAFLFLALALPHSTGHREAPTNQGSPVHGAQRAFNPAQQSLLAALASRGVGSGTNSARTAGNGGEREAPPPLQKSITGWLRTGPDAGSEPPAKNPADKNAGEAGAGGAGTDRVAALRAALPAGVSETQIAMLLKQAGGSVDDAANLYLDRALHPASEGGRGGGRPALCCQSWRGEGRERVSANKEGVPDKAVEIGVLHFDAYSIREVPSGTLREGVSIRVSRPKNASPTLILGKRPGPGRRGKGSANIILRLGLGEERAGGEWGRVPAWVSGVVAPLIDRGWVQVRAKVCSPPGLSSGGRLGAGGSDEVGIDMRVWMTPAAFGGGLTGGGALGGQLLEGLFQLMGVDPSARPRVSISGAGNVVEASDDESTGGEEAHEPQEDDAEGEEKLGDAVGEGGGLEGRELPLADTPEGMRCSLKPYQQQGLFWMLQRERLPTSASSSCGQSHGSAQSGAPVSEDLGNVGETAEPSGTLLGVLGRAVNASAGPEEGPLHPLWFEYALPGAGVRAYLKGSDGTLSLARPEAGTRARGGVLADAMGLGKTIQVLALIASDPPRPRPSKPTPFFGLEKDHDPPGRDVVGSGEASYGGEVGGRPIRESSSLGGSKPVFGGSQPVLKKNEEGGGDVRMDDVDLPGAEGDVLGGGGSEPVLEKDGGDVRGTSGGVLGEGGSRPVSEEARRDALVGARNLTLGGVLGGGGRALSGRDGEKRAGGTLVVCPLSVLAQWRDEAARHIRSGRRTLLVHYDKRLSPADLAGADIVLTTYGVVVAEHGAAQGGGVFGVKWRRIVLDEGHVIKQRSTHAAKAVCLLDAERRWVLTGTPLSNTIEDIYPLLRFIRESPWSDFPVFSAAFLRPQATTPQAQGVFPAPRPGRAEEAAEDVMSRLRGVLRGVMLRRTVHTLDDKGVPILSLPKRSTTTEILSFSAYEQDFYGALMQRSQTKFDQYMSAGKVLSNYASILEMLLRLRQACAHPYLALARPSGDADREKLARQLLEDADANGSKINCSNVLLDADASPGDTTASPGDVTGVASTEGGHVGDKADGDADSVVHGVGNTSESVKGCDAGEGSSRGYFRGVSESVRSGVVPDCPICLEPCVEPMITPCAHIFCRDCAYRALPKEPRAVSRAVPGVKSSFPGRGPASELGGALGAVGAVEAGGGGRCPVCRKALGRGDLRVLPRAGRFSVNLKESWRPSSKVDALIRDLRRVRAGAPPLGFALSDDLLLAAGNVDVDGAGNVDVKGAGDVKGPGGVEGIVGAASDVGREGRGGQGGAGNVDAEGAENVDVEGAGDVKGAGSVEGGREHAGGRSVVFSQWTSLLDILEVALEREEMPFVRFDGSMSSEKRAAALRRVEEPGGPKILLMSLKAGGVGLNLVYVRHCFLMDLWWNPQMEEQAIGRIHRIGQTHQVFVKRYLIRGSVEERILQMQIRKQSLTNSAIGGGVVPGGAKPDGAARVRELSMLFKT